MIELLLEADREHNVVRIGNFKVRQVLLECGIMESPEWANANQFRITQHGRDMYAALLVKRRDYLRKRGENQYGET